MTFKILYAPKSMMATSVAKLVVTQSAQETLQKYSMIPAVEAWFAAELQSVAGSSDVPVEIVAAAADKTTADNAVDSFECDRTFPLH